MTMTDQSVESPTIRVTIIEDQALLLMLLERELSKMAAIEVVGAFGSAEEADAADVEFDAAVVDIMLPGTNGVRWGLAAKRRHPDLGVVLLSTHVYPGLLARLPSAHAEGWAYLLKESVADPSELRRAIDVVLAGGVAIDPLVRARARPRVGTSAAQLTERQLQLLGLVSEGWSNAAIAERMVVTVKSVENALSRLYLRLGIDTDDQSLNQRVAASRLFFEQMTYPL